ncbi:MAG: hypothetical protein R3C44_25220, partial [Chloroflexota bacterium]
LKDHLDDLTDLLATYLSAAQLSGEISDRFAPQDVAHYLFHSLYSLGTIASVYLDREQLVRVAAVALAVLEPQVQPTPYLL